ncbi:MAG: thiol:disulfide interchange protein DsbA/DsbL [Roseateles sp.]|uniref:thiol:disulfide interchange protein DsbA/DsbL n=1 Tax=Roseateles sp. TaxID=1971397 RepID=UPI0039ECDCB8
MKRRDFSALLAATPLAGTLGTAHAQGGPVEGRHYTALSQPLPAQAGKIEVVEFFWYGCPHCYAFEPQVEAWTRQLPADVAFRKVHVAFRANVRSHQRMFYALEALGKEAATRPAIFAAMHQQGLPLDDAKSQAKFLAGLGVGVDPAKYQDAYNSFGVQTKCTQAEKLSEAYRIDGVPCIGVGGRFLTAPSMASGGQRLPEHELGQRALQVTDFLINRARTKA